VNAYGYLITFLFILVVILVALVWARRKRERGAISLDEVMDREEDPWQPTAVWGRLKYSVVAFAVLALRYWGDSRLSSLASATMFGMMVYFFFSERPRRRYRFCRGVVERDYWVCPQCLFDLQGSKDIGRCPECGAEFTHETLRRGWIRVIPPSIARKLGVGDNQADN
jgi:RNA polymerase subunit RPABC4/transcription elongation factor Spt4